MVLVVDYVLRAHGLSKSTGIGAEPNVHPNADGLLGEGYPGSSSACVPLQVSRHGQLAFPQPHGSPYGMQFHSTGKGKWLFL